jgi:hypothetical protein
MSRITLAPNAAGTGTLTVAAPNTSTDYTLTLPTATTTLVGTDATQTLTNKSIAASQLTGALPAIDGSALTGIVTGSLTLLGTLTTTSGTTQTLSGLNLTSYKLLYVFFNNVQQSSGSPASLGVTGFYPLSTSATGQVSGNAVFDLASGKCIATTVITLLGATSASSFYCAPSITNASTSIGFLWSVPYTFNLGSITVYGVK